MKKGKLATLAAIMGASSIAGDRLSRKMSDVREGLEDPAPKKHRVGMLETKKQRKARAKAKRARKARRIHRRA